MKFSLLKLLFFFIVISINSVLAYDPLTKDMLLQVITKEYNLVDKTKLLRDYTLGNSKAPIVMIEYYSFSCIHCATFSNEVFPEIYKHYIKTDKVFFITRDFPLDLPALKAGMLARCFADKVGYLTMHKALFANIREWAFKRDFLNLLKEKVARIIGISDGEFDKCMNNKALQEQLISNKIVTIKLLKVQSTPTFFIDGKEYKSDIGKEALFALFDKKLTEHHNYSKIS